MGAKNLAQGLRVLVVGYGSIGSRHLRNLLSSGHLVRPSVVEPRKDMAERAQREYAVKVYESLNSALSDGQDAVLVCTPPVSHVDIAIEAARSGAHVFVEKPLSDRLDGVQELIREVETRHLVGMTAFNFRFHPHLRLVKSLLDEGAIGSVYCLRSESGSYLPGWHPTEDYRMEYSARRDLGGGIILDAIHEIDMARWLLGEVREVCCYWDKISDLEIETEDLAAILLRFANRSIGEIHLDYVQRSYSRNCKLIGEAGTITWDITQSQVGIFSAFKGEWQTHKMAVETNDMYVAELKHFLDCILHGLKPEVTLRDGERALAIALAAKTSGVEKRTIILE
ncbi:MAG: Gfo/Idh/MocA family oxidoreductase [Clostridia bacterium]|nr:MAG: Gfo/Idh/MocA family oxidoreductase [Clostridia bacterium]